MSKHLFTSESVTEGHPDKIADQISDSVLDAILAQDPNGRVACETLVTTGLALVAGEITTTASIDYDKIVREIIAKIGYDRPEYGFDAKNCAVIRTIGKQSPDIAQGVDTNENKEQGAGDQGMMLGFAIREAEEFMPLPIMLAHQLVFQLAKLRKDKTLTYLRPDGKSQVTVEYQDGKPVRVDTVVISTQHGPEVEQAKIKKDIIEQIIRPVLGKYFDANTKVYVNPTGCFIIGGPQGDCGVTGRKTMVDTYGSHARHGGGCFSGKDPSKVDRSAAYAARYIAKNIVAANLADKCEVQLSYAIGVADPMAIYVDTFGTGKISEEKFSKLIYENFPVKPADIIKELKLKRPIYCKTASYGHFGRIDPDFTWERTDRAEKLASQI